MKYYLGIDLGGTNVRVAKISEDGEIIEVVTGPSNAKGTSQEIMNSIISLINKVDYHDCKAIGVCVPGAVDTVNNIMLTATNIPAMERYPIGQDIEKVTGLKVFMDNDANAAGLAEACVGAGKGKKIVYYFTHSTGIGGALVVDGKVVSGKNGCAGEIGNIIVRPNAPKVNNLNKGSVENWASGTGLALIAKQKGLGDIDAKQVFDLAKSGNKIALEMIDDMAYDMALMMSSISMICDPDCYVIGGGVAHGSDLYFDKMHNHLNDLTYPLMKDVPIYKASLKEPGIVGAAMIAKSNL